LGLRPRPRWRSIQRSPEPLALFKASTSKGGKGRGKEEKKGEWKGKGGKGEEGREE